MTKSRKLNVVEQVQKVELTPEQKLSDAWENFTHTLEYDIKYSQESLDKFAVRFSKNPAEAFEWSAEAFSEAARSHVAKEVQYYAARAEGKADDYVTPSKLEVIKQVRSALYEEVVRKARWPEHSTSQPHNLMHQQLNAQRAEWLSKLDQMLARLS